MCLQAKDYLGCIKAQENKSTDITSLRLIQGKTELTGNSCPRGHAYSGAGYCTEIRCWDSFWDRHPELAGWNCKKSGLLLGKPIWGSQVIKAVVDPKCPNREPIVGTQSSCTTQADLEAMKASKKKKRKPLACRNGTWSPDHPQCKESESAITSPMDMD